jgi:hypothetical protein
MLGQAGQWPQAVRNVQKSFQLLLAPALDARVIMLRVDNGGWHVFLDLVDEVETCGHEQLLPAWNHAHFPLHSLVCAVLGLYHSITLRNTFHRCRNHGLQVPESSH